MSRTIAQILLSHGYNLRRLCAALSLASAALPGHGTPITITQPFINFENSGSNSLGFGTGIFFRLGANSVTPNGNNGTTGVATLAGSSMTRSIAFQPSPTSLNFFQGYYGVSAVGAASGSPIFNPWTMTFTNGTDTATAIVQLTADAKVAPFVNNITLSGTSRNPTFTWTPPVGVEANGYRINIFDKSLITKDVQGNFTNLGNIVSRNFTPDKTSYTVTDSDFSLPGYAFNVGKNYSIQIVLLQTRDHSSTNLSNPNLASVSRVFADFTPTEGGAQIVNLPVTQSDGSYKFNMSVAGGAKYFIDPLVAVGYDYQIGAGNPNFLSVELPVGVGDALYDIWGHDASGNLVLLAENWMGGQTFDFGGNGRDWFRVTDIETSAGLDPANTTAFVTGLTFTGSGEFTGTQTPITVDVPSSQSVPEPQSLVLILAGMAGIAIVRRTRRLKAVA